VRSGRGQNWVGRNAVMRRRGPVGLASSGWVSVWQELRFLPDNALANKLDKSFYYLFTLSILHYYKMVEPRKTNGILVGVISLWPSHPKKMSPDRLEYPVEQLTGRSSKLCGPCRTKGVAYGHPAEFRWRYFPQWYIHTVSLRIPTAVWAL
jgi:hypothetical protein